MVKIVCIKEHRSFGINKPGDELFVINTDGYDPTFWKVIEDSTPGNTETEPEPEPELTPPEPAAPATAEQKLTPPPVKASKAKK